MIDLDAIRARDRDYDDVFEAQANMSKDIAHRLVAWPVADRRALLAYVDELRSRLAEAERDADQLLKERDHAEGMADKLADALATMLCVDIGEHSSGNCPWTEALEAFEERATDSASNREIAHDE